MARSLTVVAAVIRDERGRVLLARRPPDRHMGGLWEFPGGKVGRAEAPTVALARELAEELGVTAEVGEALGEARHEEPGLAIRLLFFEARVVAGEPRPLDGQQLAWVEPARLRTFPTPPADAELVARLAGPA